MDAYTNTDADTIPASSNNNNPNSSPTIQENGEHDDEQRMSEANDSQNPLLSETLPADEGEEPQSSKSKWDKFLDLLCSSKGDALNLLFFMIALIWFLLHPIMSITTGEFHKARGMYLDEHAILLHNHHVQPYNAQKDYSYQTFGFDVNQKTVYDGNSSEPSSSLFIHGNSFREDICDGFHRMNSLYGASGAIRCIYVEGNQVLNQNSDDKKMRGMYLVALHPRNSHSSVFSSESIVFVVENFFTNAKDNSNEGTHVRQMLLALLHRLSQGGSWLSRTLLFVLPDQSLQTWADSEETIHSFLDLYASGQLHLLHRYRRP